MNPTFGIKHLLFLLVLISSSFWRKAEAYHSNWIPGFSTDTHSEITEDAYFYGDIDSNNFPDIIKFEKNITEGDSDEKEAHQGSDVLDGNSDNLKSWFGDPTLHWKKLLEEYKARKFDKAYHRLGVLIHLTADGTVPSHVRICPHGLGNEYHFGPAEGAQTSNQPSFENDFFSPIVLHIDGFEKTVDELAVKDKIPIFKAIASPRELAAPDRYLEVTRLITKMFLDNDPYWDRYWRPKSDFASWGSYGPNGDVFGQGSKKLGKEESILITALYNVAIGYTGGQLRVVSKMLPPLTEAATLSPTRFDDLGTRLSVGIMENRTKKVKVKLTVNRVDGPPVVDEQGHIYDGSVVLDLKENKNKKTLPFDGLLEVLWKGDIPGGKVAPGSGQLFLVVIDEDGNESEVLVIPFEYVTSPSEQASDQVEKQSVGKPPTVGSVSYAQLHKDYDETPHRYRLSVSANDPDGGALTYIWQIDCGYFVGETNSTQVEWRYNTPGECIGAVVTVKVIDTDKLEAQRNQKVF